MSIFFAPRGVCTQGTSILGRKDRASRPSSELARGSLFFACDTEQADVPVCPARSCPRRGIPRTHARAVAAFTGAKPVAGTVPHAPRLSPPGPRVRDINLPRATGIWSVRSKWSMAVYAGLQNRPALPEVGKAATHAAEADCGLASEVAQRESSKRVTAAEIRRARWSSFSRTPPLFSAALHGSRLISKGSSATMRRRCFPVLQRAGEVAIRAERSAPCTSLPVRSCAWRSRTPQSPWSARASADGAFFNCGCGGE
jgi:hypothetical protein